MIKRTYEDYLRDIIDSIDDLASFTKDLNFEAFTKDKKTSNAVIRSIEVIGEASKKIPPSIKNKHPPIPWKKMSGMRDKMVHEYFGVDLEIVWKTVREDIPPLKPLIQEVLDSL